ncbi:MAG: leucine-rich repeat domain-containing protein [Muribaculaceae bacterium]|nr:leucine-rich repeat domain-containing protein [Muribaculaceae bacterium]
MKSKYIIPILSLFLTLLSFASPVDTPDIIWDAIDWKCYSDSPINEYGEFDRSRLFSGTYFPIDIVWNSSSPHPTDFVYADAFSVIFISENSDEVILTMDDPDPLGYPYKGVRLADCIRYNDKIYKVVGLRNTDIGANELILPKYLRFMDSTAIRGATKLIFNDGFTVLGHDALANTFYLEEIEFPASLTYIMSRGIGNDNYGLENLKLPDGLFLIDNDNFCNFTKIEEVNLPDRLQGLGKNCFNNCTNLKRVRIGHFLSEMKDCFNGCPNIEEIVIDTFPWINIENCFRDVDKSKCVLKVPRIRLCDDPDPYKVGFWEGFQIEEYEMAGVTTPTVDIPSSTTTIYDIDGIKRGSEEEIPDGQLYIRQTGNKSEKLIKR